MATVQTERQLSADDLIQAVKNLKTSELEGFVKQVLSVQAHRRAPALSKDESRLLLKINQGVPADAQKRFNALIASRQAEMLTPDEHDELIRLSDQMEALDVKRLQALQELAVIRNTSLTQLMKDLHIKPPSYG
ncbi:MAG: STAS/SEC14 domain-containing protein [bacterium]|nr:STAS/SEC14 domain-containing protein [bacterium]